MFTLFRIKARLSSRRSRSRLSAASADPCVFKYIYIYTYIRNINSISRRAVQRVRQKLFNENTLSRRTFPIFLSILSIIFLQSSRQRDISLRFSAVVSTLHPTIHTRAYTLHHRFYGCGNARLRDRVKNLRATMYGKINQQGKQNCCFYLPAHTFGTAEGVNTERMQ